MTVELSVDDNGLRRIFKAGGQTIPLEPPSVPRAELDALRAEADRSLPDAAVQARIGRGLYRLLLGGRNEEDLFPRLAAAVWDLPPGATARTLAVAVEVCCGPEPCDPWPLRLPWHLTAVDGERLADCCGWSFESTPQGLRPRSAPVLSPEPPVLLLVDERIPNGAPGATHHGTELTQLLERSHGFAVDLLTLHATRRNSPPPHAVPRSRRSSTPTPAPTWTWTPSPWRSASRCR